MSAIARVVYIVAMLLVSPEALARIQSLGYEVQVAGDFYVVGYLWPEGHFCPALPDKPMLIARGGKFKIELTLPSGEKRRSRNLSYEGKTYSICERKPARENGFVSTLPTLFSVQVLDVSRVQSVALQGVSTANLPRQETCALFAFG